MKRCNWVTDERLYIDYHDQEWGKPQYDDQHLFEMLCLEGAQSGLSWWTILKKRENYREAFDQFDPRKIVAYDQKKIEELSENAGIVRNKQKIKSVISNAKAYLAIVEAGESFSDYLWQFVQGEPIINHWQSHDDVPASTDISTRMARALKIDGFKYVGPTVCYAFMQAVGMVNDHTVDCFCHPSQEQAGFLR